MALLQNPGFVAMLSGVEKTASGASYYFIDHPVPFLMVDEGDTFTLTADHNQSSVTSINWEEASNADFGTDLVELADSSADISDSQTLALTIGPVKESRFPRPTATGGGGRWDRNRYYRCKIVYDSVTYYSSTTEVMCDWPDPAGTKQTSGTFTTAGDP